MKKILLLALLPFTSASADATLCNKGVTAFTCEFEHTMMSVCHTEGKSDLSFRFGKPNAIGLQYPQTGSAGEFKSGTEGDATFLEFSRGSTTYRILSKPHEHSLIMTTNGKQVDRMDCKEPNKGFSENIHVLAKR